MRKAILFVTMVSLTAVFVGCSRDSAVVPDTALNNNAQTGMNTEAIAVEIAQRSGWTIDPARVPALPDQPLNCITNCTRVPLVGDVVHYTYDITVGTGPYDTIVLHRVVREPIENKPIRSKKSIMLLHGSGAGFDPVYLYGTALAAAPDEQSIAVYLAGNGVDVWGIDLRWVSVPQGLTDFSFMADWDLAMEVGDLGVALGVARLTRLFTGNGFGKMHLLGYSRGVGVGFAYLNGEAQLPRGLRHVAGFIPVDGEFKTDWEENRLLKCESAATAKAVLDGGVYQDELGVLAITLSYLAQVDPDGTSPVFPPLTNYQTALYLGANTYLTADYPLSLLFHFVAGVPGPGGVTTELIYTDDTEWIEFLGAWSPYMPYAANYELAAVLCDEVDLPYDDHLGDIRVPIFYVGAGGGLGEYGTYTTTLVGSSDVSTYIADLEPPENRLLDFGHVDLFSAANADEVVWPEILDWIESHSVPFGVAGGFRRE